MLKNSIFFKHGIGPALFTKWYIAKFQSITLHLIVIFE